MFSKLNNNKYKNIKRQKKTNLPWIVSDRILSAAYRNLVEISWFPRISISGHSAAAFIT